MKKDTFYLIKNDIKIVIENRENSMLDFYVMIFKIDIYFMNLKVKNLSISNEIIMSLPVNNEKIDELKQKIKSITKMIMNLPDAIDIINKIDYADDFYNIELPPYKCVKITTENNLFTVLKYIYDILEFIDHNKLFKYMKSYIHKVIGGNRYKKMESLMSLYEIFDGYKIEYIDTSNRDSIAKGWINSSMLYKINQSHILSIILYRNLFMKTHKYLEKLKEEIWWD